MKGGREWEEKEDGWMRRRKGKDGEERVEGDPGIWALVQSAFISAE